MLVRFCGTVTGELTNSFTRSLSKTSCRHLDQVHPTNCRFQAIRGASAARKSHARHQAIRTRRRRPCHHPAAVALYPVHARRLTPPGAPSKLQISPRLCSHHPGEAAGLQQQSAAPPPPTLAATKRRAPSGGLRCPLVRTRTLVAACECSIASDSTSAPPATQPSAATASSSATPSEATTWIDVAR